jgi:hypothetical protein
MIIRFIHHTGWSSDSYTILDDHQIHKPYWMIIRFIHHTGWSSDSYTILDDQIHTPYWMIIRFIHHTGWSSDSSSFHLRFGTSCGLSIWRPPTKPVNVFICPIMCRTRHTDQANCCATGQSEFYSRKGWQEICVFSTASTPAPQVHPLPCTTDTNAYFPGDKRREACTGTLWPH